MFGFQKDSQTSLSMQGKFNDLTNLLNSCESEANRSNLDPIEHTKILVQISTELLFFLEYFDNSK